MPAADPASFDDEPTYERLALRCLCRAHRTDGRDRALLVAEARVYAILALAASNQDASERAAP